MNGVVKQLGIKEPPRLKIDDVAGTQSIQRTLRVLRYVGSRGSAGATLSGVVRDCALRKATAHRILAVLVREGFLRHDNGTRIYELGHEAHILGWSANERLRSLAQASMVRICRAWEDTAFLSIRCGNESVCIDRHVGGYPVKTLTMEIGSRRPLGVGAGSTALLAFLDRDEIDRILSDMEPDLVTYPAFSVSLIRELVRETQHQGFSFNDGRIVSGVYSVGVPILRHNRQVVGALSVSAVAARMEKDRRTGLVAMLKDEAARISELLQTGEARMQRANQKIRKSRHPTGNAPGIE